MSRLAVVIGTYNRLPQLKAVMESLVGRIQAEHEIVEVPGFLRGVHQQGKSVQFSQGQRGALLHGHASKQ